MRGESLFKAEVHATQHRGFDGGRWRQLHYTLLVYVLNLIFFLCRFKRVVARQRASTVISHSIELQLLLYAKTLSFVLLRTGMCPHLRHLIFYHLLFFCRCSSFLFTVVSNHTSVHRLHSCYLFFCPLLARISVDALRAEVALTFIAQHCIFDFRVSLLAFGAVSQGRLLRDSSFGNGWW